MRRRAAGGALLAALAALGGAAAAEPRCADGRLDAAEFASLYAEAPASVQDGVRRGVTALGAVPDVGAFLARHRGDLAMKGLSATQAQGFAIFTVLAGHMGEAVGDAHADAARLFYLRRAIGMVCDAAR